MKRRGWMQTPRRRRPEVCALGANYVPSAGWFYSWLDFAADDVRRDFADLAGLGLDHVRIFPVWPWVQPNRGSLRSSAIDDILTTIDCAAEFGLDVAVDLLQGHLSSFDFLPSWVSTWHRAGIFDDVRANAGITQYVATLSAAVGERSNVFAITLGNEINNLWPENPTTIEQSSTWAAELVATAAAAAPNQWILHSLFDDAFYAPEHPFSIADVVSLGAASSVHSWVFNGAAAVDGPLALASTSHADYLVELAAAAATDPGRPVWLQEVGAPIPPVASGDTAQFAASTLDLVAHNPALWGITWWCSHDVDRALLDFPEREYDLGLFTQDHERKPVADAVAEFARRRPSGPPPVRPALLCPVELPGDPRERAQLAPGSEFHRAWLRLRAAGPVAIVTTAEAQDPQRRRARGIGDVVGAVELAERP
jgi:endo-1,4-beta-mannosidase